MDLLCDASGISVIFTSHLTQAKPKSDAATPPTMLMEIAVCTNRVMCLLSLAPKYCAASTFAPVDNPVITLIINAVIAPVAPSAARLSGLPKRPITTISAA